MWVMVDALAYFSGLCIGWFITQKIYVDKQNNKNSFWTQQLGTSSFIRGDLPIGGSVTILVGFVSVQTWLILAGVGMILGVLGCTVLQRMYKK